MTEITAKVVVSLSPGLLELAKMFTKMWFVKGGPHDKPPAPPADDPPLEVVMDALAAALQVPASDLKHDFAKTTYRVPTDAPEPNPAAIAPDDAAPVEAAGAAVSSLNSAAGAKAPAAAFLGGLKWGDARFRMLVQTRERGAKWPAVLDAVNALEGAPIASAKSCEVQYFRLKAAGDLPKYRAPPPKPAPVRHVSPPAPPAPKASGPLTPERVSMAEAIQWAAQRGVHNGAGAVFNLAAVNAKRAALGQPPFELTGRRG